MMAEDEDSETKPTEAKNPGFTIDVGQLEMDRRAQWKGAIQQELQVCVQQAAEIRKKITDAKTKYKKEFYGKKFAKIQSKVMQMIAALQRLEARDVQAAPEPHVHDENCKHEHKENEPTPSQAPA